MVYYTEKGYNDLAEGVFFLLFFFFITTEELKYICFVKYMLYVVERPAYYGIPLYKIWVCHRVLESTGIRL